MTRLQKFFCTSRQTTWGLTVLCLMAGVLARNAVAAQSTKPERDVIVFTNGDQLTGTIERGVGDSIVFKSDTAGEITVPMSKVRELRSHNSFVVIQKGEKPTRVTRQPGTITYGDNG